MGHSIFVRVIALHSFLYSDFFSIARQRGFGQNFRHLFEGLLNRMKKKDTIEAQGFSIQIYTEDFKNDYISLTDIAKYRNNDDPRFVIQNWMRNRNTLEFIGLWEALNNENFNRVQFDTFRNEAGLNRFTMTPQKWIESTNAIIAKAGRYGGTYAHYDIAMEFASWLSPEFKLYIIQDYKRLKSDDISTTSSATSCKKA